MNLTKAGVALLGGQIHRGGGLGQQRFYILQIGGRPQGQAGIFTCLRAGAVRQHL